MDLNGVIGFLKEYATMAGTVRDFIKRIFLNVMDVLGWDPVDILIIVIFLLVFTVSFYVKWSALKFILKYGSIFVIILIIMALVM